jgi:hypothetical protein
MPRCTIVEDSFLKPLHDGDVAIEKEDGIDFCPWFRVHDIDSSRLEFRTLHVWNGNNFQPMMRAVPAMRHPDDLNTGNLLPSVKGNNLVVDCEDSSKVYALCPRPVKIVSPDGTFKLPRVPTLWPVSGNTIFVCLPLTGIVLVVG